MQTGRRTAWVVGALVGTSACSSSQVTPLGPVPAGVTVDLQGSTYQVGGTTEDEILRQMNALGPGGSWFRYNWRIGWNYRYDEVEEPSIVPGAASATVCEMKNVQLTLTFTRTLPRWEPGDSAPEDLILKWEGFTRAVRIHGEGHRDIVIDATRELLRELKDLETSNCSFMEREARSVYDRTIERYRNRSREYVEETQWGRNQGANWPYRGGSTGV